MDKTACLNHTKWACWYHILFMPKGRRKMLFVELRKHLEEAYRILALHKESRIEAVNLIVDHVHVMISSPPRYSVSQLVGYIKGRSAIRLVLVHGEKNRKYVGQHFRREGILSRQWDEMSR